MGTSVTLASVIDLFVSSVLMHPKLLLATCFVLLFTLTFGQEKKEPDNLYQTIPTLQGQELNNYFSNLYVSWLSELSDEEALTEIQKITAFCTEQKLHSALVYTTICAARIYWERDRNPEGLVAFQHAVDLSQAGNDKVAQMTSLSHLGGVQKQIQLYNEGINNYLAATKLATELKDTAMLFYFAKESMSVLMKSGNTEMAIKKGVEAIPLFNNLREDLRKELSRSAINVVNTVAMGFGNTQEYDSAFKYSLMAEKMAVQYNDELWIGLVNGNRAVILMKMKRYPEALRGFQLDIKFSKKYEVWASVRETYIFMCDLHMMLGDRVNASLYLDSVRYVNKMYNPNEDLPTRYWKIYSDLKYSEGDYASGREALMRYTEQRIKDITQSETSKVANAINVYDMERKKNEIEVLKKNEIFQQEQIRNQRWIISATISALILAILLTFSFIHNYRRQKRTSQELSVQRDELARAHNEIQTAYKNLETAQDTLVRTEKMAVLGRLTSGIAHEVNTPLGAVKASYGNINRSFIELQENIQEISIKIPPASVNKILNLFAQIKILPINISFSQRREMRKNSITALKEMNIENAEALAVLLLEMGITDNYEEWKDVLRLPHALTILQYLNELASIKSQNENIGMAVNKAAKILFALKSYSHSTSDEVESLFDVTENVETVLSIYSGNLSTIEVDRQYESVSMIKGNPDELSQVWTNIIHNAIQAMASKGKLMIAIKMHTLTELKVEISDTGRGISAENQKRLFEPFFTTKQTGEGTGLGLSIVQKIVQKHHGQIEVVSEIEKGALFRVILPVNTQGSPA